MEIRQSTRITKSVLFFALALIIIFSACSGPGGGILMGKPAAFSVSPTFKDIAY